MSADGRSTGRHASAREAARRAQIAVTGVVALAGLLLVVLATRSGRVSDFHRHAVQVAPLPTVPPRAATRSAPPSGQLARHVHQGPAPSWLSDLLLVLAGLVAVSVATVLVIVVVRIVRGVQWRPRAGRRPTADDELAPDAVAAQLSAAVNETLATIERGQTRDAIIACWLRLEDVAAQAGTERLPSQTAAEFTASVLGAHRVHPQPLTALADLYREARYSTHEMPDRARRQARGALELLRDDLARPEPSVAGAGAPSDG